MPYTQLTNLDYLDIKESLKTYMKSQSEFTDYDFEGSALSHILDVLAYNTYYTAFNTNLIANEFFIDSATLRDNVVRIAKQLGYKPKSRVAPKATIDFTTTVTSQNKPSSYTLKKGSGFITNFDNSLYNYVVIDDVTVPVSNGIGYFSNVQIYEGTLVKEYFTYDESTKNRFIISNPKIDTSTLRVNVYQNSTSTSKNAFFQADNILDIDASSSVYFIEEVNDEKYEISFGDGVFGTKLETGNYIEVTYLLTDGPTTNGVSNFRFNGILVDSNEAKYPTTVTVTNVTASDGGSDIETVNAIKFNAPRYFGTQDRAVTAEDFKPIITKIYPNVSDIISYGGEDEVPPEYGVVKIIVKPKSGAKLSSSTKREIESELKKYMVASVRPVIMDPSILYVEVISDIFYSKIKTNQTKRDIETKCIDSLIDYIDKSEVEKFSGKFRYSKVNGVLDSSDDSIQSNETSFVMRKDFYPQLNSRSYYEVCYQNSFDKDCEGPTVKSTGFVVSEYPLYTVYLKDIDGRMVLYRIGSDGRDVILDNNAGEVDYMKGEVRLYSLSIIKGSFYDNKIEIRTVPLKKDIFAFREQYLKVDIENSTFTARAE